MCFVGKCQSALYRDIFFFLSDLGLADIINVIRHILRPFVDVINGVPKSKPVYKTYYLIALLVACNLMSSNLNT